jgi:hypothetical protein
MIRSRIITPSSNSGCLSCSMNSKEFFGIQGLGLRRTNPPSSSSGLFIIESSASSSSLSRGALTYTWISLPSGVLGLGFRMSRLSDLW